MVTGTLGWKTGVRHRGNSEVWVRYWNGVRVQVRVIDTFTMVGPRGMRDRQGKIKAIKLREGGNQVTGQKNVLHLVNINR